jgi:soluble P-type ATPase
MKIFKEEEWEDFAAELEQAEMDTLHKKEKLEEIHHRIESGLTLIGSTIVEDKLQDNVPEVIKELRQADIKIWMLTGDKLSTAYNIGLSCNLINKEIKTFFVEGVEKKVDQNFNVINKEEQEEVILKFVKEYKHFQGSVEDGYMKENNLKFGILLDEKALLTITNNEEIAKIFLEVAKEAVAVICCRVSPLQKSQVVKLMKNYDKSKITLAIGDGGNDVSMIMEAHIGIGIYGEEGLRAAQSSDYAIGEFKVLRRLLFFHGYLNLMRNSVMVIYFFYKNFVFTIIHFFYGFLNDFSGQTIIEDYFIILYNLLFTSIPLACRGILDISLRKEDGIIVEIALPYLYKEQRDKPIFNIKNFLLNQLKGIIHAMINYYITIYVAFKEINKNGNESNLWVISAVLYTNILIIVTVELIIFTKFHTFINWIIILSLTFVMYILFLIIVEKINMFTSTGSMNYTFNSSLIWFDFILVSGICSLIDLGILCYNQLFVKSIYHQIRNITNKDDISYETIKNYPTELKDILLEDDTVKMKNNIKPKARIDRGSIKKLTHRILARDNAINEENVQIFPIDNKQYNNTINSISDKKKKKIVKKKKKKLDNNLIDNKVDSIIYNPQDEISNIKITNNKIKRKNIDSNNDNLNIDINHYESTQKNLNENIGGDNNIEVKKIKNNMKPFSNIRFNNRNVKNNRNDISKGQLSMQRDQTDRGLLKSNL